MTIEVGPCDRQYALDTVNIILCDLKLEEDPRYKVKDFRLQWQIYTALTAVLFIISLVMCLCFENLILGICAAIFGICTFISSGYLIHTGKIMKELMDSKHRVSFSFSPDEIVCDTGDKKRIEFSWEYFRYIKVYGGGIYFIPKIKAGNIVAIPIQCEKDVRTFLSENDIGLGFWV